MKLIVNILTIALILCACTSQTKDGQGNKGDVCGYDRISDDNTWGYTNTNGDTVIPLGKYNFLNPIDEHGMIYAQKGDKYGYIDIKQEILVPFIYEDLGVFSEGLAPAKLNGKYGYIDRRGEVIIPFQYENQSYFYKCGLARVMIKNKWGFINQKGDQIIPIEFYKVDYNKVDSLVLVNQNAKWAFFNNKGIQLTDFIYDEIFEDKNLNDEECFMDNGLILVRKGKEYGYLGKDLKEIIGFGQYEFAEPLNKNGYAIVSKNSFYGIINSKGQLEVPLKYSLLKHPEGMYGGHYEEYYVWLNGRVGLLNENTELVTDVIYDDIIRENVKINDSIDIAFLLKKGNKYGIINIKGTQLLPFDFEQITLSSGDSIVIVIKSGKYGLINLNGHTILPIENKSIINSKDWNFYIIDNGTFVGTIDKKSKKIVLPFEFEEIQPCFYDENNKFIVKKNGFYGIITRNSEIVIPIEYDYISNWVEYGPQEHFVTKNGEKGLISREGKIVIPHVYDEIEVDNSRIIKVKDNGLYGTIDWQNKTIHPIQYEKIFWEWPYFKGRDDVDTVYLYKSGNYFATDVKGTVLRTKIPDKEINVRFGYMIHQE